MSELPSPSLPEAQNNIVSQNTTPSSIISPGPQTSLSTPHHGKRMVFIAGAAIVGIGTIAGLAYASWAGYLPNPFVTRPSAENFLATIESMQSAQTSTSIYIALVPQEADVTPLDFSIFEDKTNENSSPLSGFSPVSLIEMLPSDLTFNLSVDSSFSKTTETSANEETRITGTYTGNNVSANLDISTRTIENITYIKPDAVPLPIPIFDMNALEGKWINLSDKNEERDVFEKQNSVSINILPEKEEEKPNALNEILVLLKQGVKNGAIIFSVPERVTHNNERVWKTDAVIDGEKLRDTIISIGQNRDTLFPGEENFGIFTDDFITATEKERAKDIFREIFARTTFSGILSDDGSPISLSFSTRIAPKLKDDVLKDRQITLETSIAFAHINEAISVEAPEDALSLTEAGALLLGQSMESVTGSAQHKTVTDLQSALNAYFTQNNEYPEDLNKLIGIENDSQKVKNIPVDVITNEPYIYTKTETGYTLKYEMPNISEDDFSHFDTTVPGTNTATELLFSEEGAKLTDTDEDGLSAYDEAVYGTSDYATDSDYDGYDDKAEVDGGYNPNGDGLLETTME